MNTQTHGTHNHRVSFFRIVPAGGCCAIRNLHGMGNKVNACFSDFIRKKRLSPGNAWDYASRIGRSYGIAEGYGVRVPILRVLLFLGYVYLIFAIPALFSLNIESISKFACSLRPGEGDWTGSREPLCCLFFWSGLYLRASCASFQIMSKGGLKTGSAIPSLSFEFGRINWI